MSAIIIPGVFTTDSPGLVPAPGAAAGSDVLRADGTFGPSGGGSNPTWWGKIAGARGDGNPTHLLIDCQKGSVVSPTPTNITTSIARLSFFTLPAALTVNRIRWYGVGVTVNYRMALYRYSDLVRLTNALSLTTSANAWDAAVVNVSLAANTLYFMAVSVVATGTTPGILASGTTIAATTGQIQTAPGSLPGNLDIDLGYLQGCLGQMPVTNGILPDPASGITFTSAWTGGMPAFWLDNAA